MAVNGKIGVSMTLDTGGYVGPAKQASKVTDELRESLKQTATSTKNLESHFTSFGRKFHDSVMLIGMAKFALADLNSLFLSFPTAVIKTTAEFERMTKMLEGLSGSTETAKSDMKYIYDMAQSSPVGVKAITDSFVKFRSVGLDPTNGSVRALADSVARFGGTSDHMHRASIAIQQIVGKGVVSMEELRQQLGEAVPNAMQAMATGMNMSMRQLNDTIKKGTVEAKDALQRMFTIMGIENFGASEAMMTTWSGMFEKLKTKWEIFKNSVGTSDDMFKNAKAELRNLIDSFDSGAGKRLAQNLASGLTQALQAIIALKDAVIEWGDALLFVAEAVFVGKLLSAAKNFYNTHSADIKNKIELDNQAKISKINGEKEILEASEKRIKNEIEAQKGLAAEQQSAAQKNQKIIDDDIKRQSTRRKGYEDRLTAVISNNTAEIAANQEKLAQLAAQEEAYAAQRLAADEALAKARIQKKSTQPALASINEANTAIAAISAEAAALEKKNAALAQSVTHLTAERNAVINTTSAVGERSQRLVEENRNSKARVGEINNTIDALKAELAAIQNNTTHLNAAEGAVKNMTFTQKLAQAVSLAWKDIFAAMGGWVTVAITAISALITWFHKYKSAATLAAEAQERLNRAKQNMSSENDVKDSKKLEKKLTDKADWKQREIDTLENRLDTEISINGEKDNPEVANLRRQIATAKNELEELNKKRVVQAEETASHLNAIERQRAEEFYRGERAMFEQEKAERAAQLGAKARDMEEWRKKELEAAGNDKKKLADIEKQYGDKKRAEDLKSAKQEVDNFGAKIAKIKGQMGEIDLSVGTAAEKKNNKSKLGGLKLILADVEKENTDAIRRYNDAMRNSTTAPLLLDGKKSAKKEQHPWEDYIADAKASVEKSAIDQQVLFHEIDVLEGARRKKLDDIIKKASSGKFDKSVEGKDGKSSIAYFGNKEARKGWLDQFDQQLKDGTLNVDKFVDSLVGLTAKQREEAKAAINAAAAHEQQTLTNKALQKSVELVAESKQGLEEAESKLATSGTIGLTVFEKMTAKFEKLGRQVKGAADEMERFKKQQKEALENATKTDLDNYALKAKEAEKKLRVKNETTEYSKLNQEYFNSKEKLDAERDAELRNSTLTTDQKLEIQRNYNTQLLALNKDYDEKSKSDMTKLAESWADVTKQMNAMTANWASSLTDALSEFVKTGKFKWRDMLADWAAQLNKMLIQNLMGDFIKKSGIGQLGDKLGEMLGGAKKKSLTESPYDIAKSNTSSLLGGGVGKNAMGLPLDKTKDAIRVTNVGDDSGYDKEGDEDESYLDSITNKISETWNSVIEGLKSFGKSALEMFDSLGSSLKGLWDGISSMFSGGDNTSGMASTAIAAAQQFSTSTFANGGVMTEFGSVELRKYANGGIANSPQLALYGEGKKPEAYVPLPDGRTIPVTMTGAATGMVNQVSIQISVDQSGNASESSSGNSVSEWKEIGEKVRAVVQDELVKQQRPGGSLYK